MACYSWCFSGLIVKLDVLCVVTFSPCTLQVWSFSHSNGTCLVRMPHVLSTYDEPAKYERRLVYILIKKCAMYHNTEHRK